VDDSLAGIDRIVAPAGLDHVTPGTTWWLYAVTELVPDVELGRRLLVDSDRIPLDQADRPEHAALLRSIGHALNAASVDDLLVISARRLASARVLHLYRQPEHYLNDMFANGIVVLRLV